MVDNKSLVILMTLIRNQQLSLYELSVKTKFSIKVLKDEIQAINHLLEDSQLPKIIIENGHYSLSDELENKSQLIFKLLNSQHIFLSQEERISFIYLYTFCRKDFVSNTHYQYFLKVSKNTTLTDIKALRALMSHYQLELSYSRQKGYTLNGREEDKHRMAIKIITELIQSTKGRWALDYILSEWDYQVSYHLLEKKVTDYYQTFQMTPILDRLKECLYIIIFILSRYQRDVVRIEDDRAPISKEIEDLIDIVTKEIVQEEGVDLELTDAQKNYLSLLLSGSFEGDRDSSDRYFSHLTLEIINQLEGISLMNFDQKEAMLATMKRHLIPAYYRLQFGLSASNDYALRIKQDHPELYTMVHQALKPLEREIGYPIPSSEIAYFVLHFGGYLHQQKSVIDSHYRAVIICPNGVSSSLIVKENLKILFPQLSFQGISRVDQLDDINPKDYDMIFSTIILDRDKPSYLVPMVMTEEQSFHLIDLVCQDFPGLADEDLEVEKMLATIKHYATVTKEKELRLALRKMFKQELFRKDVRPLLHELITEQTYQTSSQKLAWKEAIKLAAQPLLDLGKITDRYPQAMIEKVEEFGPFINLGKGIAIPHARPEDGVIDVGMSMLVLEEPIHLLDDPKQEIYLLICIAAVDNETHLKALSQLTTILRDKEQVEALRVSRHYQDIKKIINQEA
ncbi:BglG family transcription antiterminator [Streptococcus hongkongensis]|nr:transcription antiterminator BglG [Streptococcus uberis]